MKEKRSDKTLSGPTPVTVLGITVLALLTVVSIAATANTVSAATTEFKDYTPQYNCADITIENAVGSGIVVSWAPIASNKSVFQVNIPNGGIHDVSAPKGSYDQYVHTGGYWYKVMTGTIFVDCGFKYTYTLSMVTYNGTGFQYIPDSEAPKI